MNEEQINDKGADENKQPKSLRVMATIVSYLFHPVFFPLVMAFAVYKLYPAAFIAVPKNWLHDWFLSIGLTGVFFPLFSIFLMKQLGFISSYKMQSAKERTIPLMAIMIFYFWLSHVFDSVGIKENELIYAERRISSPVAPMIFKVLMLGNFWGIIALFMVNIFTKISMHTTAAGGMVGIIIVLMIISPVNLTLPLLISIVIAGIMGTARMILGSHQRGDIWLGYIIGVLAQLGAYWYMR